MVIHTLQMLPGPYADSGEHRSAALSGGCYARNGEMPSGPCHCPWKWQPQRVHPPDGCEQWHMQAHLCSHKGQAEENFSQTK